MNPIDTTEPTISILDGLAMSTSTDDRPSLIEAAFGHADRELADAGLAWTDVHVLMVRLETALPGAVSWSVVGVTAA